jgi:acetyltransferase-like isoleucine patch superfamily enzyme
MCGCAIGRNVRIAEIVLGNLIVGFGNFELGNDVYVGPNCFFDLTDKVKVGERTSISSGCIFLTHSDPGSIWGNKLAEIYPRKTGKIIIGADSWVGAGAIISCGVSIGDRAIVGAGSVVISDLPSDSVSFGNPAKVTR